LGPDDTGLGGMWDVRGTGLGENGTGFFQCSIIRCGQLTILLTAEPQQRKRDRSVARRLSLKANNSAQLCYCQCLICKCPGSLTGGWQSRMQYQRLLEAPIGDETDAKVGGSGGARSVPRDGGVSVYSWGTWAFHVPDRLRHGSVVCPTCRPVAQRICGLRGLHTAAASAGTPGPD
jgi:hypothetical protein